MTMQCSGLQQQRFMFYDGQGCMKFHEKNNSQDVADKVTHYDTWAE